MRSISKIVGVASYPFRMKILVATRHASSSSNTCDSGDKKGDPSNTDSANGKEASQPSACCTSSSDINSFAPTLYNCRKYGHCLPTNDICPPFDPLPNIPTGIFRCTEGERLGAGAIKCGCYQCPEYFAYQHMTFYDMHLIMRSYRRPSPNTGRKP